MNEANNKPTGQQIDRYRIVRHIARGGMADVYLAEDVDLQRKIALKLMLETLAADTQFVRRFRREARAVARLDHPNIVQIYTVGQTPTQQPYIAMQFIEGGSLRDKLQQLAERGKLLTTEQALNITRQIAEALAVAHNARIIHRDLKPGNVLIRPDGKPVLVDLGIAVVEGADKLTQTGGIIGTPHYMSPEQVKGVQLDGRSDLYSLGIILYEMLAGMRPFAADSSIAVLHQQVYDEPPPLNKRRPDLPPQVTAVVETCLKKEPSERFPQAEAMIAAIDRALQAAGKGGPNPRATQVLTHLNDSALISRQRVAHTPTTEQKRRPIIPVWAMATLAVMVTAVIITVMLQLRGGSDPPLVAPTVTTQKEMPGTAAASLSQIPTASNTPTPEITKPPPSPIFEPTATILPPTATMAPAITLPPTATPTLTPTLAPPPTPIKVIASPATNQTFRNTPSIWKLTSFRDMQQPGVETYRVTINAGETWRWSFSWCAENNQQLQTISAPLTVNFLLDDTPLLDSQLLQHTVDESSGWKCRYWSTILTDWQRGETVKLEVRYYLSEAIYDGRDSYASGEYSQVILADIQ